MRRAALSMVQQNMKLLGCRYPESVEAAVSHQGRGGAVKVTGMLVEGQSRAAESQAQLAPPHGAPP